MSRLPGSHNTAGERPYLAPGLVLHGRYEIGREIGRGGFSAVYAAHDRVVDHEVAIKLLVPPPAAAARARERMRREVRAVRELAHEHIVAVHDFVDDGERSFVVMRLVDGVNLAERVRDDGPLTADETGRLGAQIASALATAHAHGVLHRDVKPQNILIDRDGRALLTDFGSARVNDLSTLTQTGAIIGTRGYTSPNVMAGRRADARDDVYALGMTLAFALTGQAPDAAPASQIDTLERLGVHPRDIDPVVPAWLDTVIAIATATHPADRFQTAARFAESLQGAASAAGEVEDEVRRASRCVVCGDPEPTSAVVCTFCASASDSSNDTLIVVRGDERAVARVPSAVGELAASRLLWAGRDAVAVPARLAWTAIPRGTWLLALLVCVAGFAGATVGFTGYWQPPLVAAVLLVSAERAVKTPRRRSGKRGNVPAHVHDWMVGMFAELPRGTARSLHAGLAASVRTFFDLAARHQSLGAAAETVGALYLAACSTARDLTDAESLLERAEHEAEQGHATERSPDTVAALERVREQHVQGLLEATDGVRRLSRLALRVDADALAALVGELSRQEAALREVEALLASR